MSSLINENLYEENLIKKLESLGYKRLSQEEIIKKRGTLDEVILVDEFELYIKKTYPNISQSHLNKLIEKVKSLRTSDLISANKLFLQYISEGIKIKDDKKGRTITYEIFNEKYNSFIVTNQFIMRTTHPTYKNQIPDIVIFCNGLPIIVFELKTITNDNENLNKAFLQMKNYIKYLEDLFVFNVFNVITNISEIKFGTITSSYERFQYWRGKDFSASSENMMNDLFEPKTLMKVIKNFTFFTSEKNPKKIVSSYHQYYGVKSSLKKITEQIDNLNDDSNGKAGIFWHTQGSGKSFSMIFLVKNLIKIHKGITFIIVTDRNDLDNQLYSTFSKSTNFIGAQKIYQIKSIKDLKKELKDRKQDGIYFTTIQKFNKDIGELSNRRNILIISDEAHRSHTNLEGKLEINNDKLDIEEKYGPAKYLRDAFPKSTFIGFTGTPIESNDKSTQRIFGDVHTKYLMSDAERDGVIVPIKYESRKPELFLDEKYLDELEKQHEKIVNHIYDESGAPQEAMKKLNKEFKKMSNFISDPNRIEGISKDFIRHYTQRSKYLKGKALFVAFNRHIAFEYYKKITELEPNLKKYIKLIITNSNGQNDDPELQKLAGSKEYRKKMAIEFKDDDSYFKIAIVVDMWLTGFDVPSLDVIYIDKPIKMHSLMQSIARINRVYTKPKENLNKEHGLVVDYIGLWKKLNEALSVYSQTLPSKIRSERNISELKPLYIKEVKKIYNKFKIDSFDLAKLQKNENLRIDFLKKLTQIIIKNKSQQEYINETKKISSWLREIISLVDFNERIQFQMLMLVRTNLINIELGNIDFNNDKKILLSMLEKVISYNKTIVINEIEGDAIHLSDIINYIKSNVEEGYEILGAKMKVSALKKLLFHSKKINIKKSNDLGKELDELLKKYNENYIDLNDLINGIKKIVSEVEKMSSNEITEQGFTEEEMAFYWIVLQPIKEQTPFDKKNIDLIMKELLVIINDDKKVNKTWIYNEASKAKVRKQLKVLLHKYKYPPKETDIAAEEIVEQIMYQKDFKGTKNE